MTPASMRFCSRLVRHLAALVCGLLLAGAAQAHKASDAYLQAEARPQGLTLRWDIALRDLDAALDLDADLDGRLTWHEVRSAWPAIETYAMARIEVAGCPLRLERHALERRADGVYAALFLVSDCKVAEVPFIGYRLLREVDPTHRGLAHVSGRDGATALRVLDPNDDTAAPADGTAAPQGAVAFVQAGVQHILGGIDHVLFLLCLLLPAVLRRTPQGWRPVEGPLQALWPVLGIVTAFTVAHSITLGLAAAGHVRLPSRVIEPAIAATIVLAALDNLRPLFGRRRLAITFLFGLVHGFGFAGVLAEMNLPPARFAWALLEFNLGLELGQLFIVGSAIGVLATLREWKGYPRWVLHAGSCAAMALAGLWFIERTTNTVLLPF